MDKLSNDDFKKNPDGSWTSLKPVVITGAKGEVVTFASGQTFRSGMQYIGYDIVALLDEQSAPSTPEEKPKN